MAKIIWNKGIEEGNKSEIEKYLNQFAFLIPNWLAALTIEVEPSENGNLVASAQVQEQYRSATLTFRPLFFTRPEETKSETVVHELFHIHTNPLFDFAKNAMRKFSSGENEKAMEIVFDEMECYLERQTEDLTFAILNK